MNIQWYPGHMTKGKARYAGRHQADRSDHRAGGCQTSLSPAVTRISTDLGQGKARLILLNKSDLADDTATARWDSLVRGEGLLRRKAKRPKPAPA